MNNLQNDGWELSDLKYIELTEDEVETFRLQNGDILFNRTNSKELVGKCEVFQEKGDWVFASYLVRVRIDESIAAPDFVSIFLNTPSGRIQIDRVSRQIIGMANINAEEIRDLVIPIPPLDKQQTLVAKMQAARKAREQLLKEADALLDSIDGYVLAELGIEIPKPKNNRVESRIFAVTSGEVSGRRLDPEVYYQVYSLHTKYYPMERLQNCVLINPSSSFYRCELDTSITFVPMEKVSAKYGEANLSLCKVVGEAKGYTKFRENDLIWAKITPCMENGKSAVVDNLKGGIGVGSTEFHVFRALEGINIHYIHALLRLKSLREHAVLHFTGSAGQQRVPSEFFKELIIPKPPIEKQIQIANHIAEIRTQAKQLQQEANAIVEAAKREVEQILLDGASG